MRSLRANAIVIWFTLGSIAGGAFMTLILTSI